MTYTGHTDTPGGHSGLEAKGWAVRRGGPEPHQTRKDTEGMRPTFSKGVPVPQELAHRRVPGLLVGPHTVLSLGCRT